ncbi:MAG: SDR family NAD(P)-dependent oxidoreductase [Acidimicrobiales bacterium]|jgi:NAD(P)-dependent dehydrogenase (short-subunit alcohol dehydrogenase family)
MHKLQERVAVVTGAASGIGLAIVEAFVAEGMRVVMADRDEEKLRAQVERLNGQAAASVHAVPTDVTKPEQVERSAAAAVELFGALHVAVNNAGIVARGYSWELSLDEWRRVLDVDLWGVIHGVRAYVPLILSTGDEGHVVNVASMAAVMPLDRLGPYTVAKHGVLGLTDVLHAEFTALGAPVGASVVMPGRVKTAMNPIGTVEPSTVAANVVDAIRRDRRYVFTDDHSDGEVEDRLGAILAARADVA